MYRARKNEKDVKYILDNLRKEDKDELLAIYGNNYKQKVMDNIMKTEFYVLLGKTKDKDIPVVMGGIWEVIPNNPHIGGAWLLSTDKVKNHKMTLLRELRKEVEAADEKFILTYNLIYEENKEAKKWLKWLGYRFDKPKPEGMVIPEGFEFFYRVNPKR